MTTADFQAEGQRWRHALVDDVLPWWLKHGVDRQHGGIFTCLKDDGQLLRSDKYVWSQVRALWTFAAAYNRIAADAAYLEAASQLARFSIDHGRTHEHDWTFLLDQAGTTLEGPASIQTDAFALCAMVEYARASHQDEPLCVAMQTFERTHWKLCHPGSYQTRPYPLPPGTRAHRVSMQFSLAYWELAKLTGDERVQRAALALTDDVLEHFRQPELQVVLEYLSLDNQRLDPPIGTYISAGHSVETAWFTIENLRHTGDRDRLLKACEIMRWGMERGWDERYGGLLLHTDLNGGETFLPHGDAKIWWPHCEALCGTLLAYEICREPWCLEWYERIRDWSLKHFPDHEHGEWRQRLDRRGKPMDEVVALPVKDPFHLPRALIYAIEALERLTP